MYAALCRLVQVPSAHFFFRLRKRKTKRLAANQMGAGASMLEMITQIGNQTVDKQAVLGITDEFGRSLREREMLQVRERCSK
jgi:hypothetical protein